MKPTADNLPVGIHLGGGVMLFKDAFKLDWDWMRAYCMEVVTAERETMYQPGVDPITAEEGYINRSDYFFSKNAIDTMPWRGSFVHRDSRPSVITVLEYIERRRDQCLLSYLHQFPIAGKCIWWKIKSHIVGYPVGAYIGMHADVSTDYEYGKPHPVNQVATRNTVSVVGYLNDSVSTEAELDGTNFTGGAHNFAYLDIKHEKIRAGDFLFFPSNYMAAHEVQPVTGGWRFTYLGWYCQGTPNPKVLEDVVDPTTNPELAKISTNVYMENGYSILPPIG